VAELASPSSSTRSAIRIQPSYGALLSIFRETDMALPSDNWSSKQSERVRAPPESAAFDGLVVAEEAAAKG
jgi:hypothetical protein